MSETPDEIQIQIEQQKQVYECPRFRVEEIVYLDAEQEKRKTYTVSPANDLLVVIPRIQSRIILKSKMMPPRMYYTWSFPTGFATPGVPLADTAQELLVNETGTAAQRFIYLGKFAPSQYLNCLTHVMIGEGLQKLKDKYKQQADSIEAFQEQEIGSLLIDREIDDGLALASYVYYVTSKHYWTETHRGAHNRD